jgi:hypothetical protein
MRWVLAGLLCALVTPAAAQLQTDVGTLTCTLAEQGEKDVNPDSQSKLMHCSFKPKGTGPEETYVGEIKKVGTQDELSGKRVLIWAVMGPSDRKLTPAILQQTYVGAVKPTEADKTEPPKLLVGELDKSYALQPITDDAHEPNASRSVTVVELRIKSTPT